MAGGARRIRGGAPARDGRRHLCDHLGTRAPDHAEGRGRALALHRDALRARAARTLPDACRAAPRNTARVAIALGCIALSVTPALMAWSQSRLNAAVAAFGRGDCDAAIDAALGALDAMPPRPQPMEVLGYC